MPLLRGLLLVIATATAMSAGNTYSLTTILPAPPLSIWTWAAGINNHGQVVGGKCDLAHFGKPEFSSGFLYSGGVTTWITAGPAAAINDNGEIVGNGGGCSIGGAYLYSGGVTTDLGTLPGASTATAINSSGQIVGWSFAVVGQPEAFLYSGGVMTGLGFLPGGTASQANGINASGQIVGWSTNASGNREAFLYSGGIMTGLGTLPGYRDSVATAINSKGQIVGNAIDSSGNTQAFLYSGGIMTGLGFLPGDTGSQANAINNKGQIVGASYFGLSRAFLYSGGQMLDLNSLAPASQDPLGVAVGINDSGQIVASGTASSYLPAYYLLTPPAGSRFVSVPPCRVVDTRLSSGPFGGPSLEANSERFFTIPQSECKIPATAQAYSLNVTALPQGPLGYLALWATGLDSPPVSTLNSWDGSVVANAAIVAAGQDGAVTVFASAPADLILDINGYFDSDAGGDSFYPVPPCRVADTRDPASPLGSPLSAGQVHNVPMLSSPCNLPLAASAYSTNVTVVPKGPLGFLTMWATGQPQPYVSTLNSWTGKVVANAAIVPAGINGSTSVYVTNPTDVIVDVNGYFAPSGNPNALVFNPVVPCRIADTRDPDGSFGGPIMEAGTTRSYQISASHCNTPPTAAAYSLNITVVPDGPLGFLTAWPDGAPQPYVSTLNSWDGSVVANAAIVPAGDGGAIRIYVTNRTHVILDLNGYFAP